jgi:predicted CXXCH cytochrome family protein
MLRSVASLKWILAGVFAVGVGCSGDDGAAGRDGDPGTSGERGAPGEKGGPGETGGKGEPGEPGEPGEAGVKGEPGDPGDPGDAGPPGEAGGQGEPGEGFVALEPNGLVGFVRARSGAVVKRGNIYFVSASDVAALPATTIDKASPDDEPLEDLIAANRATYQKAAIGGDGVYRLPTLAPGAYFITFVPADTDGVHLPGGSACRKALEASALTGTRLDLEVSQVPPRNAEYVGSGPCVTCHGKKSIGKTMHRNGIWSPYERGALQDLTSRKDDLYQAFGKFAAETTVYFYGYDATRGFDKYRTSETDPGSGVSFTVQLRQTGGSYEFVLRNAKASEPDLVLRVDAVYGGGVLKQRYLTKIERTDGSFFYGVLPLQFQHDGLESYTDRTRKVWRDYHGDWWYDEAASSFKAQIPKNSFEKNCASCHATSARLTGSDATLWKLDSLVSDPVYGDFDYDGDGVKDEMNIGCETCHGPGSAHWESAGQAKYIVSPSLLTPEREAMICGQCHSRPKGAAGTDSPVNAEGWMMRAGTSRADFLASHATTQLDGASSDYFADGAKHSKSHHQQYSDFIRSAKYKNDSQLVTCTGCHDPHRRDNPRQLEAGVSDNSNLCGGCHASIASSLASHLDSKLGAGMGAVMQNAKCPDCHMPKTAKTGAGRPGITASGTQYWWGDITSHLFDMPRKADSSLTGPNMPTAYTNPCGGICHVSMP